MGTPTPDPVGEQRAQKSTPQAGRRLVAPTGQHVLIDQELVCRWHQARPLAGLTIVELHPPMPAATAVVWVGQTGRTQLVVQAGDTGNAGLDGHETRLSAICRTLIPRQRVTTFSIPIPARQPSALGDTPGRGLRDLLDPRSRTERSRCGGHRGRLRRGHTPRSANLLG